MDAHSRRASISTPHTDHDAPLECHALVEHTPQKHGSRCLIDNLALSTFRRHSHSRGKG